MVLNENRVGRLYETRWRSPLSQADFEALALVRQQAMHNAGRQRVTCSDFRGVTEVLTPALADGLINSIRSRGVPPLRHGVLLPATGATLTLQIERMIREANVPTRRTFRRRDELEAWLAEVCSPDECARLREFLDEGG